MRILLISYYFPPYNSVGAVRPAKFAKFLEHHGHEVYVLSAADQPFLKGLEVPISEKNVVYTPWLNVNAPVEFILGGRKRVSQQGFIQSGGNQGLVKRLGQSYKALLHVPDGQIGWFGYALREGRKMLRQMPFDLIYASAPPFTGLMVASRLSREFNLKWVAELRDLWSDNHNYAYPRWRHSIDAAMERQALKTSSGIVTVSSPLANTLSRKYPVPVVTATNGFDPDDFPDANRPKHFSEELRIIYTGNIYFEHYDVDVFLEGIKRYQKNGGKVSIDFIGRNLGDIRAQVSRFGLENVCNFLPPVSHKEAVSHQCDADILLFFCWSGVNPAGVLTSKLFEYLGSRRPILAIGDKDSEAAQMIQSRSAGAVANTADELADILSKWAETKRTNREIARLPENVAAGLTRDEQFSAVLELMNQLAVNGGMCETD